MPKFKKLFLTCNNLLEMKAPDFLEKEKILVTLEYFKSRIPEKIDFGLILGSFLEKCTEFLPIKSKITLDISDMPHMKSHSVPGHGKTIIFGKIYNKNIQILCGRLHLYEGYNINDVVYPVKLLSGLSADNLIITNSAGGLNPRFAIDDIMIIKDHLNLMFKNPFFGYKYSTDYDYFVDMSFPYDRRLSDTAIKAARDIGLRIKKGIYAGVMGPVLETKAESGLLYKLGADAVGMSTIPEVTMANFLNIKVLGVSHIRNLLSQPIRKNIC
jgi:purine-nucleoside phosphorylase